MDFNVLLEDLKNAAENLQKNPNNTKPLSTVYCHKVIKVVDKVSNWNTEYDNVITGLWVIAAHFTETVSSTLPVPSFKEAATRLFRECAKAVLNIQWQNLEEDSDVRKRFVVSLANLNAKLVPLNYQRFRLLESLLENPWTNPTLAKIMGGEAEDDEEKEEVQNYITGEDAIILQLRVDMMLKENCEEYALNLCNSCLLHPELKRDLTLRKTQLSLLHKLGLRDKLQEECQNLSVQEAVNVIRQLQTRNTKEICTVLAQNFMVQHWIRQKDHKANKDLLRLWIRQQALADKDQDRFKESVWAIAKLSQSTDQILFFIDILREQCGKAYLQLYVDMCIFAINVDKGQMETNLKQGHTESVKARKEDMSAICGKLACLNHHASIKVARICVLTAFVLKPCTETFQSIIKFYSQNYSCCGTCTKTSNSTDHGTVNPATLYEVERLLNMLRPEYLNPDNSLSNIKILCERFCKENNLNIVLSTSLPKPPDNNAQLRMVQIEAFGKPNATSAKSSNVFEAVTPNVNNTQALLRNKLQEMQSSQHRPPSSSSQTLVSSVPQIVPHIRPHILHSGPRHPSPTATLLLKGSTSSLDPYKNRQPLSKTNPPQQSINQANRSGNSVFHGLGKQTPAQAKNPTKLNPQLIQYIQSAIRQNSSVLQELLKHPDKEIVRTVMNMLNQAGKPTAGSTNAKSLLQQQNPSYLGDQSRLPTVSTLLKAPATVGLQGQQSTLQQSSSQLHSSSSPSSAICMHQSPKTYSHHINSQSLQNPPGTSTTNSYLQKADSFRKAKIQAGNIRSVVQSSLLQKQQVLSRQMAGSTITVNPSVSGLQVIRPANHSTLSRNIHSTHSITQPPILTNTTSHSTFNSQSIPQTYLSNVQQQQQQQSSVQSNLLKQPSALSSDELSGSIMGIDDKIISELLQDAGIFSNTFPDIEVDFSLDDLDKKRDGRKTLASSDLQHSGQPKMNEYKVGYSSVLSNSGSSFSSNSITQNQLSGFGIDSSSPSIISSKGYKSSPISSATIKSNLSQFTNMYANNHQSLTDIKPTIDSSCLSVKGSTQTQPLMSVEQIREMMKQEEIDGEVTMDSSNNATYRCLICSVAFKVLEELREHVRNVCKPGLQSSSVYNTKIKQDRANSAKAGLETTTVFQCLRCFELCISQEGIKQHRLTCKRVPTVPPDIKNATLSKNNKTPPASRSTTPKMSSAPSSSYSQSQTIVTEAKPKIADNNSSKIIEKSLPSPFHLSNAKDVVSSIHMTSSGNQVSSIHTTSSGNQVSSIHTTSSGNQVSSIHTTSSGNQVSSIHTTSSGNQINETPVTNNSHSVVAPPKQTSASVVDHTETTDSPLDATKKEEVKVKQEEEKVKVTEKPKKVVPPLTPSSYSEISGSGGCKFYRCKNCSQTLCSYESLVSHWKDCATKPPVFPYRKQFPFDQDEELEPGEIRPLVGKVLQNVIDVIGAVARGEIGEMPDVDSDIEDLDFLISQGNFGVTHETRKSLQGKISKKEYPSQSFLSSDDNSSNSSGQSASKKFSYLTMRKNSVGKGVLKEKNEEINTQRAASAVAASRINESLKNLNDESDSDQDGSQSDDTMETIREAPPTLRDRTKLKPIQSYVDESFVSPFAKGNVPKSITDSSSCNKIKIQEASGDVNQSECSTELKGDFKCIVCGKICNSNRILIQHYASKHLQPYTMKTLTDGSSYFCHLCQKSFSTFVHYMHHVPNHGSVIIKKVASQYSSQKRKHWSSRIAASRGYTFASGVKKGGISPKRAKALLSKKKAAKSVRERMKKVFSKTSVKSSLSLNGGIKPNILSNKRKSEQRCRSKSAQQSLQEKLLKRKIENKRFSSSKVIPFSENDDSCASSSPYVSDVSDDDEYHASDDGDSDSTINEPPQTRNRSRITRSTDAKSNERGVIKISPTSLALVPELAKMSNIHPCVSVHRLTQSEVERFTKSREKEVRTNVDILSESEMKENASMLTESAQDQNDGTNSLDNTQKPTEDVAKSLESKKPLHPMVNFQSSFESYIKTIKPPNVKKKKKVDEDDCSDQVSSSSDLGKEHNEKKDQSNGMIPEVQVAITISDDLIEKEVQSIGPLLKEKEILKRRCSVNLGQKVDMEHIKLSETKTHDVEGHKSPSLLSPKVDKNREAFIKEATSPLPTCAVVLEKKISTVSPILSPFEDRFEEFLKQEKKTSSSFSSSSLVCSEAEDIEHLSQKEKKVSGDVLSSLECSDQELKAKTEMDLSSGGTDSVSVKITPASVLSEDLDAIVSTKMEVSKVNTCSEDIVELNRWNENCVGDSEMEDEIGKSKGLRLVSDDDAGMRDEECVKKYINKQDGALLEDDINRQDGVCSQVAVTKEQVIQCSEEINKDGEVKKDVALLEAENDGDAFSNDSEVNNDYNFEACKSEVNQGKSSDVGDIAEAAAGVEHVGTQGDTSTVREIMVCQVTLGVGKNDGENSEEMSYVGQRVDRSVSPCAQLEENNDSGNILGDNDNVTGHTEGISCLDALEQNEGAKSCEEHVEATEGDEFKTPEFTKDLEAIETEVHSEEKDKIDLENVEEMRQNDISKNSVMDTKIDNVESKSSAFDDITVGVDTTENNTNCNLDNAVVLCSEQNVRSPFMHGQESSFKETQGNEAMQSQHQVEENFDLQKDMLGEERNTDDNEILTSEGNRLCDEQSKDQNTFEMDAMDMASNVGGSKTDEKYDTSIEEFQTLNEKKEEEISNFKLPQEQSTIISDDNVSSLLRDGHQSRCIQQEQKEDFAKSQQPSPTNVSSLSIPTKSVDECCKDSGFQVKETGSFKDGEIVKWEIVKDEEIEETALGDGFEYREKTDVRINELLDDVSAHMSKELKEENSFNTTEQMAVLSVDANRKKIKDMSEEDAEFGEILEDKTEVVNIGPKDERNSTLEHIEGSEKTAALDEVGKKKEEEEEFTSEDIDTIEEDKIEGAYRESKKEKKGSVDDDIACREKTKEEEITSEDNVVIDKIGEVGMEDISREFKEVEKDLSGDIVCRDKTVVSSDEVGTTNKNEEFMPEDNVVIDKIEEVGVEDISREFKEVEKDLSGGIGCRDKTVVSSDEVGTANKNEEFMPEDNVVIDEIEEYEMENVNESKEKKAFLDVIECREMTMSSNEVGKKKEGEEHECGEIGAIEDEMEDVEFKEEEETLLDNIECRDKTVSSDNVGPRATQKGEEFTYLETDKIEEDESENDNKMSKVEEKALLGDIEYRDICVSSDDVGMKKAEHMSKDCAMVDTVLENEMEAVNKKSNEEENALLRDIENREMTASSDDVGTEKEEKSMSGDALVSQSDTLDNSQELSIPCSEIKENDHSSVTTDFKKVETLSDDVEGNLSFSGDASGKRHNGAISMRLDRNSDSGSTSDDDDDDDAVNRDGIADRTGAVTNDDASVKEIVFIKENIEHLECAQRINEEVETVPDDVELTYADMNDAVQVNEEEQTSPVGFVSGEASTFSVAIDMHFKDEEESSLSTDLGMKEDRLLSTDLGMKEDRLLSTDLGMKEEGLLSTDLGMKEEGLLSTDLGMKEERPFANEIQDIDDRSNSNYLEDSKMSSVASSCVEKQKGDGIQYAGGSKEVEICSGGIAETKQCEMSSYAVNREDEMIDDIVLEEGDQSDVQMLTEKDEGEVDSMEKNEELIVDGKEETQIVDSREDVSDEPIISNVEHADVSGDNEDHYESDIDILDLGQSSDSYVGAFKTDVSRGESDFPSDDEGRNESICKDLIANNNNDDNEIIDHDSGSLVNSDALELNNVKGLNEGTASDLRLGQIGGGESSANEIDEGSCMHADELMKNFVEAGTDDRTEKRSQPCQNSNDNVNKDNLVTTCVNDKDQGYEINEPKTIQLSQYSGDACQMVDANEFSKHVDETYKPIESMSTGLKAGCSFVESTKENSQRDKVDDAENHVEELNIAVNENVVASKESDAFEACNVVRGLDDQKVDTTDIDMDQGSSGDSFLNKHKKPQGPRNSPKQLRTRRRVYYGFNSIVKLPESNIDVTTDADVKAAGTNSKDKNQDMGMVKQDVKCKKEVSRRSGRRSGKKVSSGSVEISNEKKEEHCVSSLKKGEPFVKTDILSSEKSERSRELCVDKSNKGVDADIVTLQIKDSDKFVKSGCEMGDKKRRKGNDSQDHNSSNDKHGSVNYEEYKVLESLAEDSNVEGPSEETQGIQTKVNEGHSQTSGAETKNNKLDKSDINEDSVTEKELKARKEIREMVIAKRKSALLNKMIRRNETKVTNEQEEHDIDNQLIDHQSTVKVAQSKEVIAEDQDGELVEEEDGGCKSDSVIKEKHARSSCDEDDLSNYNLVIEEDKSSFKSYPDPFDCHGKARSRKHSSSSTTSAIQSNTEVTQQLDKMKESLIEGEGLIKNKDEGTKDPVILEKVSKKLKTKKEKEAPKKMTWLERKREAFMEKKREESVPFTWDLEEHPGTKGLEDLESPFLPLEAESRQKSSGHDMITSTSNQQNEETSNSNLLKPDSKRKGKKLKASSSQEPSIATNSSKRVSRKRLSSPTSQTLVKVRKKLNIVSEPLEDSTMSPSIIESPLTSTPKKRGRPKRPSAGTCPDKNTSMTEEKLKESPHFINIDDDEISFNTRSLSPSFASENTPEVQNNTFKKRGRPRKRPVTDSESSPQQSIKVKHSIVSESNSSPSNISDPKLKKAGLIPVAKTCTPPTPVPSPNTRKDITSPAVTNCDLIGKALSSPKYAKKDKASPVLYKLSQKMKYSKHSNVFEKFAIKSGYPAASSKIKVTSPLLDMTEDSSSSSRETPTPMSKSDQTKKDEANSTSKSEPIKGNSTAAVVKRRNPTTVRKHFDFKNAFKRKQTQPAKTTVYRVDPLPKLASATSSIAPEQFEKTLHTPLPPGITHVTSQKAVSSELKWKIDKEMKVTKVKSKQRHAPVSFKRT